MENQQNLTFEEVNKHFESANLSDIEQGEGVQSAAALAPADVLKKVCKAYKVVQPFLKLAANLPLIPSTWKLAIKAFVKLMDTLCP
ncbi:MAG: hypothetical protein WCF67_14640 [Chitinophagaceae bacterium]